MKKKIWIPIVVIIVALLLVMLLTEDDPEGYIAEYENNNQTEQSWEDGTYGDNYLQDYSNYGQCNLKGNFPLGSAGKVEGTTVVVTVMVDDAVSKWTEADSEFIYSQKKYLCVACDYLTENFARYGTEAKFICDWEQDNELYYTGQVDVDIASNIDECEMILDELIDTNVDSNYLLDKYSADNIIYMILVNTEPSNQVTSRTYTWYEGKVNPYEYSVMLTNLDYETENPSTYAHEILHNFGARDLYYADNTEFGFGITEEYLDYLNKSNSNDLMFTNTNLKTGRYDYEKVTNEFTDLDAYYVGLIDQCDVVDEWGLIESEHIRYKK